MCGEKGAIPAMAAESKKSGRRKRQASLRPARRPCYFKNPATRTAVQKIILKTCEIVSTMKSLSTKPLIVQFFQYFGATEKNTLRNVLVKKIKNNHKASCYLAVSYYKTSLFYCQYGKIK